MSLSHNTLQSLQHDLAKLNITEGDGLFVHSSMKAIGKTIGGPRTVVEALISSVGTNGLVGMPGFSVDAYFPSDINIDDLTEKERADVEAAVTGFDPQKSPTHAAGIIAETFRTWPKTQRSSHPNVSICLNGLDARSYMSHPLAWGTGGNSPLGQLRFRPKMKILLIGVGWNRCSVFPTVGEAFEKTGAVAHGTLGSAVCKVCDFAELIKFASNEINAHNLESGDRH